MDKILVVNVNWLGDAIFSTPVFKALKKAYPYAHLACLAVPRVKEVLEHCPYIDEIIVYDEKGRHWFPWHKLGLVWSLRRQKFSAALLLHRSNTRAFLMFLAGIPVRVGFQSNKSSIFLTHRIPVDETSHRMDQYAAILKGVKVAADQTYSLDVSSQVGQGFERRLVEAGITSQDYLVIINAGGNWDLKRWPADRFAELVRRLVREFRVKVAIAGADKDLALAQSIAKDSGVEPVVLAGATGLNDLMALFKRANCVISNDTGPLHLAASVGTDVVGLFGPTRPEITGPRGEGRAVVVFKEIGCNKAPCYHLSCSLNECLNRISVDDVCQAFQTIRNS